MKQFWIKRFPLVAGLLVFLVLLLGSPLALYRAPRLDWPVAWDGRSWSIEADGAGFRRGDKIVGLAGRAVTPFTFLVDNAGLSSRTEILRWLEEKSRVYQELQGDRVEVEIERAGQRLRLERPVRHGSGAFTRSPVLVHLPVGIAFFLVGWACLYRLPAGAEPERRSQGFWFYLLCFSMSLVYLSNVAALLASPTLWPPWQAALNALNVLNFVVAPTLLLHVGLLLPRPRAPRWLLIALYGTAFCLGLSGWMEWIGIYVPLAFLASLLAIVQGWWSYRGALERQQMKWVLAGFLFGVGPWLLINGLPLLLLGHRFFSDTVPGAFLVCIPLGMAVAIHRYRLFDMGALLEGTMVYLLTVAVLVFCELALMTALGLSLDLDLNLVLGTALLIGAYASIRQGWSRLLAGWFRRSRLDPQRELKRFRERVAGADSPEVLAELRETAQQLLAPEWIEGWSGERPAGAVLELSERPGLLLVAAEGQGWRCGPLPRGRFYDSDTVQLFDELARQAGLYQENALLHRRRLEERERLLGDLHDGVGSALVAIRAVSSETAVGELAGDALFELQNFLYEGPDYALERGWLVAELRRYGRDLFAAAGIEFEFRAEGELAGKLPRRLGLSVFRLTREALSNSLRHAQAGRVELGLIFGDQLALWVQDDGKGFQNPARGRGLSGIEKRVAELGGSLTWKTDAGVRLEVRLPL